MTLKINYLRLMESEVRAQLANKWFKKLTAPKRAIVLCA